MVLYHVWEGSLMPISLNSLEKYGPVILSHVSFSILQGDEEMNNGRVFLITQRKLT